MNIAKQLRDTEALSAKLRKSAARVTTIAECLTDKGQSKLRRELIMEAVTHSGHADTADRMAKILRDVLNG